MKKKTPESWFLSDLHLLARRSSAPAMEAKIHEAARQAHTLVLGGDIFDFRWRNRQTFDSAIRESVDWLKRLIDQNTACRYYYLLGNHDSNPEFVEQLQQLSRKMPQFVWHRHLLRIDKTIFLHGDIVDRRIHNGEIHHEVLDTRRVAGDERREPGRMSHVLYDAAVGVRLHRLVVQVAKRKKLVLHRLAEYLEAHELGSAHGVERVYFGHTHRRLNGVSHKGLKFFNPGAAIKGLPFEILNAGLSQPDLFEPNLPTEISEPRWIDPDLDEPDEPDESDQSIRGELDG